MMSCMLCCEKEAAGEDSEDKNDFMIMKRRLRRETEIATGQS